MKLEANVNIKKMETVILNSEPFFLYQHKSLSYSLQQFILLLQKSIIFSKKHNFRLYSLLFNFQKCAFKVKLLFFWSGGCSSSITKLIYKKELNLKEKG